MTALLVFVEANFVECSRLLVNCSTRHSKIAKVHATTKFMYQNYPLTISHLSFSTSRYLEIIKDAAHSTATVEDLSGKIV